KDKSEISKDFFQNVFVLEDQNYTRKKAEENLETFVDKWSKIYPSIRDKLIKEHYDYYFAYLDYPAKIHRMIYTTNWVERLNKVIRKTEKVRNSFPNPDSALNLICAMLMEFEKDVYRYPVTSFLSVQDKLDDLLKDGL
ncbi:MAG: transposase, partial [Leptospirales bacterium]